MLRFIGKQIDYCPEGAVTKTEYSTFIEQEKLELWLRAENNYFQRSLIGCELIQDKEPTK